MPSAAIHPLRAFHKDAYFTNANNPEQDARYRSMRELLDADPEWHDGEVIYHRTA